MLPCTTPHWAGASPIQGWRPCSHLESMDETGKNVATAFGVSREDQDAFALESQRRWSAADAAGRFGDELVPVDDVVRDEHPRPGTTMDRLSSPERRLPARRDGDGRQFVGYQRRCGSPSHRLCRQYRQLGVPVLAALIGTRFRAFWVTASHLLRSQILRIHPTHSKRVSGCCRTRLRLPGLQVPTRTRARRASFS